MALVNKLLQLFGWKVCPGCGRMSRSVERRRLNTQYVDDDSNYLTSCCDCYDDMYEHYRDLWQSYYGDSL